MRWRTPRRIAFFGLSLLVIATIVVLRVPPAEHYEISIYRAYPGYFWALIVGAMSAGLIATVTSAKTPKDRSWMFGPPLVLMTNFMLLMLPYFRGYYMYGRADPMSHLGFVRDIVQTGTTGSNIYPLTHLLTMAVTDATGSNLMIVSMLIPPVFSLLYFGSLFYLLCILFDSREQILFGLPFAFIPVLRIAHLGLRPYDLSVMLIPFTFYLFFRGQRDPIPSIRAAFVIAVFAQLLYHPLTALFVIGVFSLYLLSKHSSHVQKKYATPTNLFSLMLMVFLVWYSTFAGIIIRFKRIYFTLFGTSQGKPPVAAYTGTINEASPPLIDIVRVATFKYGIEFLLFGLGFAFLGLATILLVRQEYVPDIITVMFGGTLALFSVGGLIFLLTDLIVPPTRPFQIAKIGTVVLAGQLFYLAWDHFEWIWRRPVFRTGFWSTFAVVLVLLATLSTFSVYKSPLESERNGQATQMEFEGSKWLIEHGNATDELARFGITFNRFYHAQFGTRTRDRFSEKTPPSHFNYTTKDRLGQSYRTDHYLTITRKGRIVYPEMFPNYPERWRFTPNDFERLERDSTTNRVYDSGDYNQYLVDGTAGEIPANSTD